MDSGIQCAVCFSKQTYEVRKPLNDKEDCLFVYLPAMQKNDLRKKRTEKAVTKQFHKFLEETPIKQVKDAPTRGKYFKKYTDLKKQTYHEGANDERTAILAKVRREIKDYGKDLDYQFARSALFKLEEWLFQRNERAKSRTGGL